ncbi:MAG TPA: hypothetical protein PKD72_11330 [Gemmatales bacterium]|nr:hypothetical protein [Gemmatales bacterium]
MNNTFTAPMELWQGLLSEIELTQYQSDLEIHAQILGIQVKRHTYELVSNQHSLTLQDAIKGLRKGTFNAIQLCYDYDNRVWCDTLLKRNQGFALIRSYGLIQGLYNYYSAA